MNKNIKLKFQLEKLIVVTKINIGIVFDFKK